MRKERVGGFSSLYGPPRFIGLAIAMSNAERWMPWTRRYFPQYSGASALTSGISRISSYSGLFFMTMPRNSDSTMTGTVHANTVQTLVPHLGRFIVETAL